jgi:hypothetical protein
MNRFRLAALVAIGLVAFGERPALATTWGGEAFGAFSTHTMSDWKDATQAINRAGGTIDDPTASWGGGLGVRVWPSASWMIAATWEPIFLTRKEQLTGIELSFDANSFQLASGYFFPAPRGAKFGVGAGLDYYSLHGKSPATTFTNTVDLTGHTVGYHVAGMGEWKVNASLGITGTVGYRFAKITDTKFDGKSAGEYLGDPTIPNAETDYSGLMLRAGLAFYMP